MKNEIKILIAAIVIILIVLVGAFALNGSNNAQPSAAPSVIPATATPTPAPSATPVSTPVPTPTPGVAPTATPVPVPENASGVKLTEFGYWITYPPLGPQTWSTNPPPYFGPANNTVYFDPVSGAYTVGNLAITGESINSGHAVLHRRGDLNGTVTVTVHLSSALYAAGNEYVCSLYGAGVSGTGSGNYSVVFSPGEGEKTIYVSISENANVVPEALTPAPMPAGSVTLSIADVDGGYKIGEKRAFTLSADELTVVHFLSEWTYLDYNDHGDGMMDPGPGIQILQDDAGAVKIGIPIQYLGDTANITHVDIGVSSSGIPVSAISVDPHPTFSSPTDRHNGILAVTVDPAYLHTSDPGNYLKLTIKKTDEYFTSESSSFFKIDINGGNYL